MLDGKTLRDAIISGAHHMANHKNQVDELNVFPVPDGDTGTNMSMTALSAAEQLLRLDGELTVEQVSHEAASAMLRGARGNSGVILSLLFRGISKGLKGHSCASSETLAQALEEGVSAAYKAVMKPTEGTMLTVARMAANKATEVADSTEDLPSFFAQVVQEATQTVERTPTMLPVLKEAGVVDAGGRGLAFIFEGMQTVFEGKEPVARKEKEEKKLRSPAASYEGEIVFPYCTEFLVCRENTSKDSLALRAYLESIGDSVVVVEDDDIIKVHLHTDHPGNAFEEALKYGYLMNMKIDNMRIQHQDKKRAATQSEKDDSYQPVDPENLYGFVAVGNGEGIVNLFDELGVDRVVSGGQTMNPSTDDILKAVQSIPAKTIFVLPNNKNIILAAEQVIRLADRETFVLQTTSIPEGISAMLAFDPSLNAEENCLCMTKAFEKVTTGLVTFAARDSELDGKRIRKNEILGIENKKIAVVEKDIVKVAYRLFKRLYHSNHQFATILYGKDVAPEMAEALYEMIKSKYGDHIEINLIHGGQPVYYFIISLE